MHGISFSGARGEVEGTPMLTTVLKRAATVIPTLIGVVFVTFLLTRVLPGDPAIYFAGPAATPQSIVEIRKTLGLDKPLTEQFVVYVEDLAHGDLGNSLATGRPVMTEIVSRLPASAELTLFGLIIAMAIAIPLGILAAVKHGSWIDHTCRIVATAGVSLPVFFTGLLLVYVFYFRLGWSPAPLGRLDAFFDAPPHVTGFYLIDSLLAGNFELFRASLSQLILPGATLAIFSLAPIARMTRASMLAVLASDYVRTARASGLASYTVTVTYAFRNAMLPVITTLGMVFSFLLGANVLVEKVFAWPGIGSFAVEALIASDYAPVQGFVLTMAIMYVALNLLIDVLYGVVDPRVRLECMTDIAVRARPASGVCRAVPACPLRHRRESDYRACLRPVRPDLRGGIARSLDRALQSVGKRHRGNTPAALSRSICSAPTSSAAIFSAASWRRLGSTSPSR